MRGKEMRKTENTVFCYHVNILTWYFFNISVLELGSLKYNLGNIVLI